MPRAFILSFILASAFSVSNVYAEQSKSESKVKIDDVTPDQNKAPGQDVDEVLTNKMLRAQSGSKSKISMATAWNYKGGTVQEPLSESRPNITQGANNTAKAFLSGDLNLKYSFDQRHSILAGIGVRWITPLYGTSTPEGFDHKFDANDPTLTYQYIYKVGGLQNVVQAGALFYTSQDNRAIGSVNDFSLQHITMYEFGTSGLSVGMVFSGEFQTFDKGNSYDADNKTMFYNEQTDIRLAALPVLEYQFNDRFNFRTLIGPYWEHRRALNAWTFKANKVYQSMGLGISVTRDIFLYPNVQFIPDQLRPSQTNVALSANINLF